MPKEVLIDRTKISIDGSPLTDQQISKIQSLMIDSSLHIPDMFEIRLIEIKPEDIDNGPYKVGKAVEIGLSTEDDNDSITTLFKGEITALEPSFTEALVSLTVRGYDKAHRLHRGTNNMVYKNVKDSDIAQKIAQKSGLTAKVDATTEVYKHVFQHAQSDFDFLTQRAERIGYVVFTQNGELNFVKQKKPASPDLTLSWLKELINFRPRLTLSEQVDKVIVKGWDVERQQAFVGEASNSDVNPDVGVGSWGGAKAQTAFSAATTYSVRQPIQSQDEAKTIAQGLLDAFNGGFVEAEGEAEGVPTLHAGMVIEIKEVGTQFSGKYRVTTARHEYSKGTYQTAFTVEGGRPDLLSYLVEPSITKDLPWGGVVTALVTGIDATQADEKDWAYVKLKYPWLDDQQESYWARIVIPGGGVQRGVYFLPEVNDEVLVAFEHGDFNRPFVIGGLYNGKNAPPAPVGEVVSSGKVKTRIIKTRTGHTIKFVDEDQGQEYIEIIDAKKNTFIKFDTANKKITMDSKGEIEIHSTNNMTLKSDADITIEATNNVNIKGMQFSAEGSSGAIMKSNANATVQANAQAALKGNAGAEVSSPAMTTVKGATVMIN